MAHHLPVPGDPFRGRLLSSTDILAMLFALAFHFEPPGYVPVK
ncbi:hypothetical protein [Pseudomonas bananamidigenes]|nr:hypothetical protein [Pseudomonas bananamidigenes]